MKFSNYRDHYLILTLAGASAIVIALTLLALPNDKHFESSPLHSAIEAVGAIAAVLMAVLLLQKRSGENTWKLRLAGVGFLSMGLIDLFHSAAILGHGFVFLRSTAHLMGGLWCALGCVPWKPLQDAAGKKWLPWAVGAGSVLLGIWPFVAPKALPAMIEAETGQFTDTAIALNVTAGTLFLAAAARFAVDFHHSRRTEFFMLSCIGFLMGLSGVLFKYSMLWSVTWWEWHFIRLAAYLIALGIIYQEYAIILGQAIHDPLTRLYNRSFLTAQLEIELHKSMRTSEPFSIIMLDIDHFKQFNDLYGHDAGDSVLITLAEFLKSKVRAGDVVARFGGEEFMLVFPNTSADAAVSRALTLLKGVEELSPQHNGELLGSITISAGIVTYPIDATTIGELLRVADGALYAAKQAGRNRISRTPKGSWPLSATW